LRNPRPEWEAQLKRECIGRIVQWKGDSASTTCYRATAIYHDTGQPIRLDSSTDLAERVEEVVEAWRDPTPFIPKASSEQEGLRDADAVPRRHEGDSRHHAIDRVASDAIGHRLLADRSCSSWSNAIHAAGA